MKQIYHLLINISFFGYKQYSLKLISDDELIVEDDMPKPEDVQIVDLSIRKLDNFTNNW